ncbi:lysozyme [Ralstonia phage Hyacinthe]|uniref:Endolysin n=3 Tax=Rahariannevirus raharianne TaxID=2846050 RepID=A0A7G5BBF0_9CAUD|nr:endolysin [Ralstonia phage Raharianne]QMV32429.1 lysozyme [Ralstonia phage Albius]QMV33467.1 lysozyme [Ralstonia phage Hyacinthe]QMV33623.1 lysozyme [Ralstonia phage Raharianne]
MADQMKTSAAGVALIKRFEQCRLTAYRDAVGVLTIGYGHTGNVWLGMVVTQEQADALLAADIRRFENGVAGLLKVPVTQGQFDALVSFAFNCGLGNLGASTLLRKLNAGDVKGAAAEFPRWSMAGGVVLRGLTLRREAEQKLFMS